MKITGIKIALFEVSDLNRLFDLVLLDGMQRDRWIHRHTSSGPGHAQIMRVTHRRRRRGRAAIAR